MTPSAPPGDPGVMADPAPGRLIKKSSDYLAQLDGDVLAVSRGAKLRDVCLKCGSHHELTRRQVRFTRFVVLPPALKRADLGLPLCVSCNKRWSRARAAVLASSAAFGLSVLALGLHEDHHSLLPLCLVLFVAVLVVVYAYARPRMLTAGRIDDRFVELLGCHANAAQEIAEGSARRS